VGGSGPTTAGSQVFFVNASGGTVTSYLDTDMVVYVKVVDTSHSGGTVGVTKLVGAVKIGTNAYDVTATDTTGTFMSAAIDLDLVAGNTITVTYTDPNDSADTDTATATVTASALEITDFVAGPNPFDDEVAFFYEGTGVAKTFTVTIYDLNGHVVWAETKANVTEVVWDGTDEDGADVANGAYIYVVKATDGTNTFDGKGTVFINR